MRPARQQCFEFPTWGGRRDGAGRGTYPALTGKLLDGTPIFGSDTVRFVP